MLRPGSTAQQARAAAAQSGYSISGDYVAEAARDGKGWVFRVPGTEGDANIIRVAEANARNPTGYVRYYDKFGYPTNELGVRGASPRLTASPLSLRPMWRSPSPHAAGQGRIGSPRCGRWRSWSESASGGAFWPKSCVKPPPPPSRLSRSLRRRPPPNGSRCARCRTGGCSDAS